MAELIIKRNSNHHTDPIKNVRGSYKRGDIIDILEDDESKSYMTVIKVPILKITDIKFYKQMKIGVIKSIRDFDQNEYDDLQTRETEIKVDEQISTVVLKETFYIKPPVFRRVLTTYRKFGRYECDVEEILPVIRRRYQIVAAEMNNLFPGNIMVATLKVNEWDLLKTKIIEK